MYKARKANRVVKISDEKKSIYEKLGYTITTMDGEVIHEPVDFKKESAELKEKVSELEAKLAEAHIYAENADKKIEELTAENLSLKEQIAELEKNSVEADDKAAKKKVAETGKKTASEE